MKNEKLDTFIKQSVAPGKDANRQLSWLYLWTVLLLALTIVSGMVR